MGVEGIEGRPPFPFALSRDDALNLEAALARGPTRLGKSKVGFWLAHAVSSAKSWFHSCPTMH